MTTPPNAGMLNNKMGETNMLIYTNLVRPKNGFVDIGKLLDMHNHRAVIVLGNSDGICIDDTMHQLHAILDIIHAPIYRSPLLTCIAEPPYAVPPILYLDMDFCHVPGVFTALLAVARIHATRLFPDDLILFCPVCCSCGAWRNTLISWIWHAYDDCGYAGNPGDYEFPFASNSNIDYESEYWQRRHPDLCISEY